MRCKVNNQNDRDNLTATKEQKEQHRYQFLQDIHI